MHLFCYGTLMVPAVWKRVVGKSVEPVATSLEGYASSCVRDEHYPGLRPRVGARTEGLVYAGLRRQDLRRLDKYEGREYRRVLVSVLVPGGKKVSAWCYVTRSRYRRRLCNQKWSLQEFVQRHANHCLRRL